MRPTTSASNLFRRALCPGSARMEEGLPEEDSELSREGQLLHYYSAHPEYYRSFLKPHQRDLVDLADTLTKHVIERVESEGNLTGKPFREYIEKTLIMGGYASLFSGTSKGFEGTPDLVRYYQLEEAPQGTIPPSVALVIDKKFGFNVVERAELNLQLRSYGVMAFDDALPDKVFVSIVQPRAPYEERITIAKYTAGDIEDSRKQIKAILEASEKPDAPLAPGEEQCRYCKAKLTCPAFREAIDAPCEILIEDPLPTEQYKHYTLSKTAREAYLEKRLSEITDDQLENVIHAVKLAKMVNDPANDEARKRISAGGMTNFTVAKDAEVREVVNVRKAMSLLSLAGLDRSDTFDCVTGLSLTKLSEILRKRHPNWTDKQAKDWVNFKLRSVIELQTRKGRIMRK